MPPHPIFSKIHYLKHNANPVNPPEMIHTADYWVIESILGIVDPRDIAEFPKYFPGAGITIIGYELNTKPKDIFISPSYDQIRCPFCDSVKKELRLQYDAGQMEFGVYKCLDCYQRYSIRTM